MTKLVDLFLAMRIYDVEAMAKVEAMTKGIKLFLSPFTMHAFILKDTPHLAWNNTF